MCIEKETEEESKPVSNVLVIDLEVRNIAVTTNTANTRPNFYGQKLRDRYAGSTSISDANLDKRKQPIKSSN